MGLNIGEGISKYIIVRNTSMRFQYSEKIVFADLFVSHKTGKVKVDPETGEAILRDGVPVPERRYTKWEGRFCGDALEAAKTLRNGQAINITDGWIDKEEYTIKKTGKVVSNIFVVIADFEYCDNLEEEE